MSLLKELPRLRRRSDNEGNRHVQTGKPRIRQYQFRQTEGMNGRQCSRPSSATPSFFSRLRISPTHALLYVIQARRRGALTCSSSNRASLIVIVFVLPAPGPARTTQLPSDS